MAKKPGMSTEEFSLIRWRLDLTHDQVAELLGYARRASMRWGSKTDPTPVPGPVAILFRALDQGKLTIDDVKKLGRKR